VAAADLNNDRKAEVIVVAYRGKIPVQQGRRTIMLTTGYVRVFNGADGSLLYQFNGINNGDQFGRAVAAADVTGDGQADVIVGARWGVNPDGSTGYVRVFDGLTGDLVDEFVATAEHDWLGYSVAAGDVDGDGKANVAAGAYQGDSRSVSQAGYVRLFAPPAQ
jgi:hypothetical protein